MTTFSIKYGYLKQKMVLNEHDIPDSLKNRIWNILFTTFFQNVVTTYDGYPTIFSKISDDLRHNFFKLTIDSRSRYPETELGELRTLYFKTRFPEFYDLVEHFTKYSTNWIGDCNLVFEEERSQFRFVGKQIAPITSSHEIEEIENALTDKFGKTHIDQAISLIAKRPEPDYRNSIKESISAVEAFYRNFTGEKHDKIGPAIKDMAKKGIDLPPILKDGFSSIYGWTNDGKSGIRHPLMETSSNAGEAEARLMLVMCSAYINYLKSLKSRLSSSE